MNILPDAKILSPLSVALGTFLGCAACIVDACAQGVSQQPPSPKADSQYLKEMRGLRDKEMSATRSAAATTIRSCIKVEAPAGMEMPVLTLRLRLNRDGGLTEPPTVLKPQEGADFRTFAARAVKAAEKCAPFRLPPAQYEVWKEIQIRFDFRSHRY